MTRTFISNYYIEERNGKPMNIHISDGAWNELKTKCLAQLNNNNLPLNEVVEMVYEQFCEEQANGKYYEEHLLYGTSPAIQLYKNILMNISDEVNYELCKDLEKSA